eukprot:TRINITY_DN7963_c0_g1_i1.p1 TRINITY_DN7963_c0_g1~~TRINITY_DN7963_c0_g1_i1.p1  ORF type:complete len:535 (-),score=136.76 TRINITY_DN7963_c0_g1_i1:182-1786(-)
MDPQQELEFLRRENEELRSKFLRSTRLQHELNSSKAEEDSKNVGDDEHVSLIVLGASGDLAQKKTYPALLSLFGMDLLPKNFSVVGYARSKMSDEDLRKKVAKNFKEWKDKQSGFLDHCFYFSGQYDAVESFHKLSQYLAEKEKGKKAHRIFYFAVPSSVFVEAAQGIKAGAVSETGWTRIILEKPLGKDLKSSDELSMQMAKLFSEDQIFRIDHYLGKEMVQNLLTLRFANMMFEPLWNRHHIASVQITFKEDIGTEGRAGYFNEYGIIRDVMQNHLIQMLALVAMEPPVSRAASDIQDEKVKVLRFVQRIDPEDVVVGQFAADAEGKNEGYLDEKDVPKDSTTPTFASAVFKINNDRWSGVPFVLKCGKGLDVRKTEIRVQFNDFCSGIFDSEDAARNELVIRVQPNEAVYLKMNQKVPGLSQEIIQSELDLTYKQRFDTRLPEAYERLLYDVVKGDHSRFVRDDELNVAWRIITPMLEFTEKLKPLQYPFGSRGPKEADKLVKSYGFTRNKAYQWVKDVKGDAKDAGSKKA